MFTSLSGDLLRRLAAQIAVAGTLMVSSPAASKPVVYPRPVYPPPVYPVYPHYHPAGAYHYYPGRLCNRTERRWVPATVRYDRYGNVERVRGRMVTFRVKVPC